VVERCLQQRPVRRDAHDAFDDEAFNLRGGNRFGRANIPAAFLSSAADVVAIRSGFTPRCISWRHGTITRFAAQQPFEKGAKPVRRRRTGNRAVAAEERLHGQPNIFIDDAKVAARLGRAVYHMLRQQKAFDVKRFWNGEPKLTPAQAQKSPAKPRRRTKGARCVLQA
jgi:hypothetical protein